MDQNIKPEKGKRNVKENGYKSAVLHANRNRKRTEAEARQREYAGLTVAQKIKRAKSRPGESKRELARLSALKAAAKAA